VTTDDLLARSRDRRAVAVRLIEELSLVDRWSAVGRVVQVGAVAHNLVVSPDIDFEVYSRDRPVIRECFEVVASLAEHPRVSKARFWDALDSPDQGLYFQVRALADDARVWKVDTWVLGPDHPGPRAAALVEPMRQVLTDELRATILRLKEARGEGQTPPIESIDLYRAVIDDGIGTVGELRAWLDRSTSPGLTEWKPRTHG
jgi:hypothetical protein